MTTGPLEIMVAWGRFVEFVGQVGPRMMPGLIRNPSETVRQYERVAWGGSLIVIAAGLCVGLVIWLQTHRLLERYGTEASLPSLLSVAVVVETGPLLAGLLVAGRLGAGLAAELGTMKLTEELEARTVLGGSVILSLVVPRVWACLLALPLLTILLDASALLGAFLAEQAMGQLDAVGFFGRIWTYLNLIDALAATAKTTVFGALIGLVGCHLGLEADRSSESIGHAATRGVVFAMLAVFASNVALVFVIQALLGPLD